MKTNFKILLLCAVAFASFYSAQIFLKTRPIESVGWVRVGSVLSNCAPNGLQAAPGELNAFGKPPFVDASLKTSGPSFKVSDSILKSGLDGGICYSSDTWNADPSLIANTNYFNGGFVPIKDDADTKLPPQATMGGVYWVCNGIISNDLVGIFALPTNRCDAPHWTVVSNSFGSGIVFK